MLNELFGKCKELIIESVNKLKGTDRRKVLAKFVKEYGYGGKSVIARNFRVGRDTLTKGLIELETGKDIEDKHTNKGRKSTLEHMPNLERSIKEIADEQSQIDPKFQSIRLYTKLTVKEFRKQLINKKGFTDSELPSNQTLNIIINKLGYNLKKVQKTKPLKKIDETDDIFKNLNKVHEQVKKSDRILRLSLDAKDRVKIGNFSRGGKSRIEKEANDHDFGDKYVTPFGIMDVGNDLIDIFMIEGRITADCIVDRLEEYWDKNNIQEKIDVLLINLDNGPESHSRRTQFIKRMVEFAAKVDKKIILAYYPPYHSKYNPIERFWGMLEQHWNGELLDTKETVIKFAQSVTWNGKNPEVSIVEEKYDKGNKLKDKIMKIYESSLKRLNKIEKWFVVLNPEKCKKVLINLQN
jgi:flagellin-specific chaperone FliS